MSIIHDQFMLQNELAKKLYDTYAKDLPIIDYHCHLDPKVIYENKPFKSIADVWLSGDHYKWRLMRAFGISENHITGQASEEDKFKSWAKVAPNMFGNPVFHWTQLELKRYFDIDLMLSPENGDEISQIANHKLKTLLPRDMIKQFNVEVICTTDDPIDSLIWHQKIKDDPSIEVKVLPTFRPDKGVNIELKGFVPWISSLEDVSHLNISNLTQLKMALRSRLDHFEKMGGKLADHALDIVVYEDASDEVVDQIFKKRLQGGTLDSHEIAKYKTHLMIFFAKEYKKRQWTQQYHIGAYRNTNDLMFDKLGPDTGYDAIMDQPISISLGGLLNRINSDDSLPKTILYTLNPNQFDIAIPLMQTFQDGSIAGKIQFGSAWWFLDSIDGMRRQMRALQNYGLFSTFIGMLTDSRSFLSYPRHEYFRRLLCQVISEEVLQGYYPYDIERLGKLVSDISYHNVKRYLNF